MDHLGCRREDCYAIGDSTNDLPMLLKRPHSIAMGHAPEEVKALASYVTDDIEQDGLAKGLAHLACAEPQRGHHRPLKRHNVPLCPTVPAREAPVGQIDKMAAGRPKISPV